MLIPLTLPELLDVCLLGFEEWGVHSPPPQEIIFKRPDNIHKVSPVASPLECNDARAEGLLNQMWLLLVFDQFDDHKP